jgi:hypothetical protein
MIDLGLPNYYLIDTQPEARLSPGMITEACKQIKRNRLQYAREISTEQTISVLARLAENWQDDLFPFRKLALRAEQVTTGFSPQSLAKGLDVFFGRITEDSLHNLIAQDLGDSRRLDEPLGTPEERAENRTAMACGPKLISHITAGNLPCPALMSLIHGVLVGAAQFVKCAENGGFMPRLFAHSIYDAHAKLGSCIELASWPGGNLELEQALFDEADCITATGHDQTLQEIRARVPEGRRFLGYGHRLSFGYIQHDMLSRAMARELAKQAATDVAAWNQLGCLSPHLFYVEGKGAVTAELFAEMLSEELVALETEMPRGEISIDDSADITYRRDFFDLRAVNTGDVRQWKSEGDTSWTVVYEQDPVFVTSCLNRFVHVKAVEDLDHMMRVAEMARGKVSTVGLAAPKNEAPEIVKALSHWGVSRVCPIGQMQNPPLGWRHDGRPTLGDMVTWTDWEH